MRTGLEILLWVLLAALPESAAARPSPGDPNGDSAESWAGWVWVDGCHVLRSHQLSDFGTYGSLWVAGDTLTILSSPSAGKNATGYAYIATLKQDLWSHAALITYAEGGSPYTLDHLIGDTLGTNGLAEPANLYLSRLFLLQNLPTLRGQLIAGRIVLSDFFDTNRAANCETTEFLSDSLVNNPTIPFPEAGLGVAGRLAPVSWLYLQGAAGDALAVATASDFKTAFHGVDNLFGIFQMGVKLFPPEHRGDYRFLFWHNPASAFSGPGEPRANQGFGVSFDQKVVDDLTLFLRYGSPDAPVAGLSDFWSFGARLDEPFPGRDHDSFQAGLALGQGTLHTETLVEIGYNLHVTDDLSLTPILQIIDDPAENPHDDAFVLAGLRALFVF